MTFPKLHRRVTCAMLAVPVLLSSCKEEPFQAAYFAFIDDGVNSSSTFARELKVSPDGGTRTFTLVSNRAWSIEYQKAPWITVSPTSGHGVATITFTIAPNTTLDEESILLNITNNTLPVVRDFKVTRQNFMGEYKGTSVVNSPSIPEICTGCTAGEDPTSVTSSVVMDIADGRIGMTFKATVEVGLAQYYNVEIAFGDAAMQTLDIDGKIAFNFTCAGTYDMTALGEALGKPGITGTKEAVIDMTLQDGALQGSVLIEPAWNGNVAVVDPGRTIQFVFTGNK